jgi:hypothetical protein
VQAVRDSRRGAPLLAPAHGLDTGEPS